MKIIVLGAGQVGSTVARTLSSEDNDVTVVDTNGKVLQALQDRLDLRTVQGSAAHPSVLRKAGVEGAEMLIAATSSDEVNMIACQIAYRLFGTPTKIARLRASDYIEEKRLFCEELMPIDVIISPERLITTHIRNLISIPGALQVLDFANGKVQLVGVKAFHDGPLVGHPIRDLHAHLPETDSRVAAIYRDGEVVMPTGSTMIHVDDEVFFVSARKNTATVLHEIRPRDKSIKNILIVGGGNIGRALSETLVRNGYRVKIIESSAARVETLATELDDRVLVLQGEGADQDLLRDEGIEKVDFFCALTNHDEANVLSAMLAKKMGADKVLALINHTAYVDLMPNLLDVVVSPQQITTSALLRHVRRGDVVAVHSLRGGSAEAMEAIAHGTYEESALVGRRIDELELPDRVLIGAVVRNDEVYIAHGDLRIEDRDHIVFFCSDKRQINMLERFFRVGKHG